MVGFIASKPAPTGIASGSDGTPNSCYAGATSTNGRNALIRHSYLNVLGGIIILLVFDHHERHRRHVAAQVRAALVRMRGKAMKDSNFGDGR